MLSTLTDFFGRLISRRRASPTVQAKRVRYALDDRTKAVVAFGDIHGRLDLLVALEDKILGEISDEPPVLVMLGDYIDRGPHSAQVIEHLMAPLANDPLRVCLAGNHEIMFLDFFERPQKNHPWLHLGGWETLNSYGIETEDVTRLFDRPDKLSAMLREHVPQEHMDFLRALPTMLISPTHVFVHAGLAPSIPLARQTESVLLWRRCPQFEDLPYSALGGRVLVHGHTPHDTPFLGKHRINIDTGAYATGILSAVRLSPSSKPVVVRARGYA